MCPEDGAQLRVIRPNICNKALLRCFQSRYLISYEQQNLFFRLSESGGLNTTLHSQVRMSEAGHGDGRMVIDYHAKINVREIRTKGCQ
jgi:hypothetical protein